LKLIKLELKNFRNLKKIEYEPSPALNIFIGDNAQGKTNLLESIFVLATGNSFRKATDANLVNYEKAGYAIKGKFEKSRRVIEASLHYEVHGSKVAVLNNKKCTQTHEDRLKVVLFTPDDLFLVKGSPAGRRTFLDFILKQLSGDYFYNLSNFTTILKKRNLLLKREQTKSKTFNIVNDLFIENSIRVVMQRINFINILEEITRQVFQEINYGQNDIRIRYALSFAIDNDKINTEVLKIALRKNMEKKLSDELVQRKTMLGPHLDDINIYQDGRLARTYASQGQQRNIAISLKLAELYAFEKIKGFYPVFLLDEVLAELDEGKRDLLLRHLEKADFQTFLTSVNAEKIKGINTQSYLVKEGCLIRKGL